MRRKPRILIAGLGNVLLQDDGVGVHAARILAQDPLPGVQAVEIGTWVLDALHLFEWADHILAIDAMQAGGTPGTIYRFSPKDVATGGIQTSLHELSLISALRFLPIPPDPHITILGVEPAVIDYGLELSPDVARAIPDLLQAVRDIVTGWRHPLNSLKKPIHV